MKAPKSTKQKLAKPAKNEPDGQQRLAVQGSVELVVPDITRRAPRVVMKKALLRKEAQSMILPALACMQRSEEAQTLRTVTPFTAVAADSIGSREGAFEGISF